MARVEFASVSVSFFIHSTEDSERLLRETGEKIGLERGEFESETIEGHFGNAIITSKAHLTSKRAAEVAKGIFDNLSSSARSLLVSELDRSTDEHDALYLRIDRQSQGREIVLSDEEPIRVKLKPKIRAGGRQSMLDSYKEMIRR